MFDMVQNELPSWTLGHGRGKKPWRSQGDVKEAL